MPYHCPLPRRACCALTLALLTWLAPFSASASPRKARVLPTSVTTTAAPCLPGSERREPIDPEGRALAHRIDSLVADAVEDAGLELELRSSQTENLLLRCPAELELLTAAQEELVIFPELIRNGEGLILRLVVATPHSKVLRVSTQEVGSQQLDVRTIVMVSELLSGTSQPGQVEPPRTPAGPSSGRMPPKRAHSPGRGVLTLTSGFLGGGVGYSLQRASGSDDPRLTYPLIALGTGLGLGASMIAADEWDISVGEAWYLNAGMLWPAASGLMLARAYRILPTTDRYAYGLAGTATGLALSSFALSTSELTEGDAVLTHSGGTAGLFFGGLVNMVHRGKTDFLPWYGMGYGSALGVLAAGAAATQLNLSSSRVVFIDMGIGLGALTGAAVGSPLLFVEDALPSSKQQRAWLGVLGLGAIAGGGLGWYFTRGWSTEEHDGSGATLWPYATFVPDMSASPEVTRTNLTAGVQGVF